MRSCSSNSLTFLDSRRRGLTCSAATSSRTPRCAAFFLVGFADGELAGQHHPERHGEVTLGDGGAVKRRLAQCTSERVDCSGEAIALRLGAKVDIIFDLTGDPELRKKLRTALQETHNQHTVIAPEVVAHLLWNFFGEGELPRSSQTGY